MKNFSFSGERGALSWGKNEGIERERDVLGGEMKRKDGWGWLCSDIGTWGKPIVIRG